MKKTVYTCDRCGHEMGSYETAFFVSLTAEAVDDHARECGKTTLVAASTNLANALAPHSMLCARCKVEFSGFMKGDQ